MLLRMLLKWYIKSRRTQQSPKVYTEQKRGPSDVHFGRGQPGYLLEPLPPVFSCLSRHYS